ncbi:uncharacterized protein NPIL_132351 [Nephila pilipes]|uniref:Uncharacterized protein n=1 Tax=Nephila pilipes TaxID=299642 RepID=A0A8X6PDJ7_NEPPI|nr:uncharacterized protein NPIL_132351 [Nephila pilipes]
MSALDMRGKPNKVKYDSSCCIVLFPGIRRLSETIPASSCRSSSIPVFVKKGCNLSYGKFNLKNKYSKDKSLEDTNQLKTFISIQEHRFDGLISIQRLRIFNLIFPVKSHIRMTLNFVPSLEHIALVKVAVALYNSAEVTRLETEHLPLCKTPDEEWKILIRSKVSNSELPTVLQEKVINLLKPLSLEFCRWQSNNQFIPKRVHRPIYMHWRSVGTIDGFETAKRLLLCRDLTFNERFFMACHYWMKKVVVKMWKKASATERINLVRLVSDSENTLSPTYFVLQRWFDWLKEGSHRSPSTYSLIMCGAHLPIKSLVWQEWPSDLFVSYLAARICEHPSDDDRIYISNLDIRLQQMLFKKKPFATLKMFLEWPLTTKFMEMIGQLRDYLTPNELKDLLELITTKIETNWKHFDYVSLLKDLKQQNPHHF